LRIAFILDTMIYGGIERVSIDYMKILLKQGHKLDVFILNPKVEDIVEEIPNECKIHFVHFPKNLCPEAYWTLAKRYKWGKFIFPLIYSLLLLMTPSLRIWKGRKEKYDLAIAFSGHYNDLTFAVSYIKAHKRLAWLHGSLSNYFLMSPGFAFLYNKIKNLVVLSNDSQEEALMTHKLDCSISKIYNPIFIQDRVLDLKKVERLQRDYGEFALMVGRFGSQKDHKTVIEAIKVLKTKYYKPVKTVFVGDGPNREAMEAYAKESGISDLITFVGTKSDVQNYYKAAKLFIHSSPAEGLPTVLLEAMSLGIPIVATDSRPGVREILGESEFGLICPIKDAEIMAGKIYDLITNNDLCQSLVQKGYKRIEDFSPDLIATQLELLINEIGLEDGNE
jgi:glycosyltransferase involved in cell wall biosynthesis